MSELSGALTDFPLRQVLRLVASGHKSGILVVTGDSIRGSLFFDDGRVIFATTRSGPSQLRDAAMDRRRPADADERRILVSVVMRLLRLEQGTFVFQSDVRPMHPTTGDVDVETLMHEADQMIEEWEVIEAAIGAMTRPYTLHARNDTEDVVLPSTHWNIMCHMGTGASAAEIAASAGLPEFDVAAALANLVDRKLIAPAERMEPTAEEPAHQRPAPPPPPPLTPVVPVPQRMEPERRDTETPAAPAAAAEPTLAERYEFYVNSRGAELREPPPDASGIVLDLTGSRDRALTPAPSGEPEPEPAPASELARRWRDLQKGRPVEDE